MDRPANRPGAVGGGANRPEGTLYIVATPIGNLSDVTLRALEVLRAVPLVAAEDTRLTRRLWARHGISTPLVSYHVRNAARRDPELLAHLQTGRDLALVSDAGTPLISDPGEGIVAAWASQGGRVVAVPGASAVLAALAVSGIPAPSWSFEGFLPRSGRERRERLARIGSDERATVLFESPRRTAGTLADLATAAGGDRRAALCRELTKMHEETWRGTLSELAARASAEAPRGEVTLVVAGAPKRGRLTNAHVGEPAGASIELARGRVDRLVAKGLTRSAAAKQIAQETGLPRRELFRDKERSAARKAP